MQNRNHTSSSFEALVRCFNNYLHREGITQVSYENIKQVIADFERYINPSVPRRFWLEYGYSGDLRKFEELYRQRLLGDLPDDVINFIDDGILNLIRFLITDKVERGRDWKGKKT